MNGILQKYFPAIRTREEILTEIGQNNNLNKTFLGWNTQEREEFLDFCTGVRGVKLLYDSFFKEIMDPDAKPERLEELLSLILGRGVKIFKVLPNETVNVTDNKSLLVMDIVLEMDDGSLANVEVQKLGYAFPGQRCACYSSDLLLRQYKRVKKEESEKGKKFSYKDIKRVYTIVFFEKSTKEFHKYPDDYIHYMKQESNTGLQMELLQEFVFIPLDIFKDIQHNKGITNKLEAWLTLLSMDEPEQIVRLIQSYPDFRSIYEDAYKLCLNIEKVMEMFSEELLEFDRNTVDYMIDEMQNTIDAQNVQLEAQKEQIEQLSRERETELAIIQNLQAELAELKKKLAEKE